MKASNFRPKKGAYLLSEPFLRDPNFARTVVLLTEHDSEGSVGFVLNRPTPIFLNDVIPDFPEIKAQLYEGGPVQPETLHYIHKNADLGESSLPLGKGVFWGGDFEKLKYLVAAEEILPGDIRFFLGYSGWGANQLMDELKSRSWLVTPASLKFTFTDDTEHLWQEIMRSKGGIYEQMSNYPVDPSLN